MWKARSSSVIDAEVVVVVLDQAVGSRRRKELLDPHRVGMIMFEVWVFEVHIGPGL